MEIVDYLFSGRATEKVALLILLLAVFILGGLLFISGIKIKKQSEATGIFSLFLGIFLVLAALYFMFWVIIFGYNS